MAPEEIVAHLIAQNRSTLHKRSNSDTFTAEQVLGLMNTAAMQGFRFGSESAISAVKGSILVKQARAAAAGMA